MASELTDTNELAEAINADAEWLIIRENGESFAAAAAEIASTRKSGCARLALMSDFGFKVFGLRSWSRDGRELLLNVSTRFGGCVETIRLVPRLPAAELRLQVEFARIGQAAEIARITNSQFPHLKLKRVALRSDNGRIAEARFEDKDGRRISVIADVTEKLSAENLLSTALLLLEGRSQSRKPVAGVWIAGPKKQARPLQKMCSLLRPAVRDDIRVIMLQPEKNPACRLLRNLPPADLWREKPKRLSLPKTISLSAAAKNIVAMSPEQIDVIHSRQGETLRFFGLPFARVRTVLGREKVWFGLEGRRSPLTEDARSDLSTLVKTLGIYRCDGSENRRHRCYRLAPEAWLESILLRNVKLLDSNLILSPIYNQFRASNDKIDLLALRRDGRLVVIEIKVSPDREMVLQAADYWRKIELQRRGGQLARARAFGDLTILDKPALVYAVAPALGFHREFEFFARKLAPEIELWRFELHENWRKEIKVIGRKNYNERG